MPAPCAYAAVGLVRLAKYYSWLHQAPSRFPFSLGRLGWVGPRGATSRVTSPSPLPRQRLRRACAFSPVGPWREVRRTGSGELPWIYGRTRVPPSSTQRRHTSERRSLATALGSPGARSRVSRPLLASRPFSGNFSLPPTLPFSGDGRASGSGGVRQSGSGRGAGPRCGRKRRRAAPSGSSPPRGSRSCTRSTCGRTRTVPSRTGSRC